ncbi:MAG: hypothetical protein J6P61_01850 [Erysipelotrichaceae bacterium]|nr:hypothetical protein [Erysipelotrichaceae bacterium]
MKKILLLGQSLLSPQYETLEKSLPDFGASGDVIMIFTGMQEIAECIHATNRYQHLLAAFDAANIDTMTVDAFDLDEYLYANRDSEEDLYLTPTNAINPIISSVAMTRYKGNVFACIGYNRSAQSPKFQNVQPYAVNYLTSKSFGTKGLQREPINNPIGYRGLCHFMIGDQVYFQHIGEQRNIQSGQEGITFVVKDNPKWRVKIYDRPLYQFEVTKLKKFTEIVDDLPLTAIPLAVVYDEKDQPIGIVMRNFEGETINLKSFHQQINAETVAREIMKQVIAMQLYGIYHKDLAHNILCNFENCLAHVIDIDSTQYLNYPATTKSADKQNGVPIEFDNDLLFYHSIDLSYTMLTIMISAYMNPADLLGLYDDRGHVILDEDGKNYLREKAPHLARLVVAAYEEAIPASCAQQLAAINLDIKKRNEDYFNHVFAFNADEDEEDVKEEVVTSHQSNKEIEFPKLKLPFSLKKTNDTKKTDQVEHKVEKTEKKKTKEIFDYHKDEEEVVLPEWQKKILEIFLATAATSIEGETDEERWERFIKTGEYKKPLMYGIGCIVAIIVLLILFIFM